MVLGLLIVAGCGSLSSDSDSKAAATPLIVARSQPSNPVPVMSPGVQHSCDVAEAALMPSGFSLVTEMDDHQQLHMVDASRAVTQEIVSRTGFPVVTGTTLQVTTTMIPNADGAEIHLVYDNLSSESKVLGRFNVTGLNLGTNFTLYDITQGTEPRSIHRGALGEQQVAMGLYYPSDLYSPLMLLKTDQYNIGISLNYPVLEYKHHVKIFLARGAGSNLWTAFMDMESASLPPGGHREYILNVRVLPAEEHLMKVLIPYRNYFQSLYGGVKYRRDPRPVRGVVAAYTEYLRADNPFGFSPTQPRPDIHGYSAWANAILSFPATGYHRTMIWAIAGLYLSNPNANYPYQFMTHMRDNSMMASTYGQLATIPSDNLAVGYWWGHAGSVVSDWNHPVGHAMNPYDPNDVRRGFDELDMAVDLGATMIGLDAFSGMPDWDGYVWLQMMQERAPNVFFIGELSISDFIHSLAGTWLRGDTITRENLLADFLLPGHESWLSDGDGALPPETQAQMGYVPMMFSGRAISQDLQASPSWLQTIPPELRPCSL